MENKRRYPLDFDPAHPGSPYGSPKIWPFVVMAGVVLQLIMTQFIGQALGSEFQSGWYGRLVGTVLFFSMTIASAPGWFLLLIAADRTRNIYGLVIVALTGILGSCGACMN